MQSNSGVDNTRNQTLLHCENCFPFPIYICLYQEHMSPRCRVWLTDSSTKRKPFDLFYDVIGRTQRSAHN